MIKLCPKCQTKKEATTQNFAWKSKSKGTLQSYCKVCHKEYRENHYQKNKTKYINKSKEWATARLIEFYEWLKTQQCVDCGNDDFRVLDLDHLYNKQFDISRKIRDVKFETLLKEIAKCEVVCANCHRIRTAERGNWYQYLQM